MGKTLREALFLGKCKLEGSDGTASDSLHRHPGRPAQLFWVPCGPGPSSAMSRTGRRSCAEQADERGELAERQRSLGIERSSRTCDWPSGRPPKASGQGRIAGRFRRTWTPIYPRCERICSPGRRGPGITITSPSTAESWPCGCPRRFIRNGSTIDLKIVPAHSGWRNSTTE